MLTDKQGALHVLMEESAGEEQKLREERSKVIQQVEEKLLKVYERIRKSARNHLAVVVVKREACGGCFNRVPPQKQADIKEKKSIIVCEHCGRIIADVIPILLEED
jgi:predicted  nucleic acid-binding Zn-ribbon protein